MVFEIFSVSLKEKFCLEIIKNDKFIKNNDSGILYETMPIKLIIKYRKTKFSIPKES